MNIKFIVMLFLIMLGGYCILAGVYFWVDEGYPLHGLFHNRTLAKHPLFVSILGLTLVLFANFEIKIK